VSLGDAYKQSLLLESSLMRQQNMQFLLIATFIPTYAFGFVKKKIYLLEALRELVLLKPLNLVTPMCKLSYIL